MTMPTRLCFTDNNDKASGELLVQQDASSLRQLRYPSSQLYARLLAFDSYGQSFELGLCWSLLGFYSKLQSSLRACLRELGGTSREGCQAMDLARSNWCVDGREDATEVQKEGHGTSAKTLPQSTNR
jgi:hypothetical protein